MGKLTKVVGFIALAVLLVALAGCSDSGGYKKMSMEDATQWMEDAKESYLLVDVRTSEEYESGHIPGALLLPIEDIKEGKVEALPDKSQAILLYCRTGRRAEDSAALLADMGYRNVYAIGGIFDWTGEVVTGASAS